MRLICPHCMSGVTVADDTAGQEAACPTCGKSFPTPARYTAAVSEAASAVASGTTSNAPPAGYVPPPPPAAPAPHAPAGYVPPTPAVAPTPEPTPDGFRPPAGHGDAAAPAGYTRSAGLTFSPDVIAWLPAVLLTAVFAFTFFPWVGCYAGASPVYSQRPWGAMFGTMKRDFRLEEANTVPGGWLDKVRSDWEVMVPLMLALVLAIAFAWAERGLGAVDPRKIPPLARLWPWRNAVVAGLAALVLLLLVIQVFNGFGMERAIRRHIAEKFAERREKAVHSKAELDKLDYDQEQEYKKYSLERTWWLYLALGCSATAVLAVLLRVALDRRGNKPPPKLLLHY